MRPLAHALAAFAMLNLASAVHADTTPRFPPGAVWNQDISQASPHPQSGTMISSLATLGGFGFGRMQIDFGLQVVRAPAGAPTRTIVTIPGDVYYFPDCEAVGSTMPVPANAAIEAVDGLVCDNTAGDCHLLVVQGQVLYEAYRANALFDAHADDPEFGYRFSPTRPAKPASRWPNARRGGSVPTTAGGQRSGRSAGRTGRSLARRSTTTCAPSLTRTA